MEKLSALWQELVALAEDVQRVMVKLWKLQEVDAPAFLFKNSLRAVQAAQITALLFCALLLAAGLWYVARRRYRRASICAATGMVAAGVYALGLVPLAQLITQKGGL